jgi:hypothetical protein
MEPRVKKVIQNYQKGNIKQVYEYLNQSNMNVDPSTWAGQIKQLIENKEYLTAKALIETTAYKFLIK